MSESPLSWLPWSAETFRRAESAQKPVLLSLVARWCGLCRLMDRETFADPQVAEILGRDFVPVRVDADDRPDINERYNLGGWPTTAFLTPRGDLLAGGTFFPAAELKPMLAQLPVQLSTRRAEIEQALRKRDEQIRKTQQTLRYTKKASLDHEVFRKTVRGLVASFDPLHAGFGTEPKFPMPASVALALRAFHDTGGPDFQEVLFRTLEALGERGLFDPVDGGFFRYAAKGNWTGLQTEKLTEENAALARIFLDAWVLTGTEPFRERAAKTFEFLRRALLDPVTGLFGVALDADEEHYALPPERRRERGFPAADRRPLPVPNAAAASAFLRASFVLGEASYRDLALRCLEALPAGRGFLRDEVHSARAFLDAYESTGAGAWRERAARVLEHVLQRYPSAEGGLRDRRAAEDDVGDLRNERRNIAENAVAAEELMRLSAHLGEPRFREAAEAILTSFPDFLDDYGHYTAEYAVAMDRAVRPPTEVRLRVSPDADGRDPLVRSALSAYLPRRVVRREASSGAREVLLRLGATESGPARTPEEFAALLRDLPR